MARFRRGGPAAPPKRFCVATAGEGRACAPLRGAAFLSEVAYRPLHLCRVTDCPSTGGHLVPQKRGPMPCARAAAMSVFFFSSAHSLTATPRSIPASVSEWSAKAVLSLRASTRVARAARREPRKEASNAQTAGCDAVVLAHAPVATRAATVAAAPAAATMTTARAAEAARRVTTAVAAVSVTGRAGERAAEAAIVGRRRRRWRAGRARRRPAGRVGRRPGVASGRWRGRAMCMVVCVRGGVFYWRARAGGGHAAEGLVTKKWRGWFGLGEREKNGMAFHHFPIKKEGRHFSRALPLPPHLFF